MITARDLGITDENLLPLFCASCGNRIGWTYDDDSAVVYCEDCAKERTGPEEDFE